MTNNVPSVNVNISKCNVKSSFGNMKVRFSKDDWEQEFTDIKNTTLRYLWEAFCFREGLTSTFSSTALAKLIESDCIDDIWSDML